MKMILEISECEVRKPYLQTRLVASSFWSVLSKKCLNHCPYNCVPAFRKATAAITARR